LKPAQILFSSYPACTFSGDDFYVNKNKVGVVQSTLGVLDQKKYINLIDFSKYIPEYMRLAAVAILAQSGKEFTQLYKSFKNHMYITEWLVVDYNVLDNINKNGLHDENSKGLMYIIDESPNLIKVLDKTPELLSKGSFGTFNLPYFNDIANDLGYDSLEQIGITYSFYNIDLNQRFFLMREIVGDAQTPEDFRHVLEYNSYKQINPNITFDPSYNDPNEGIAGRSDLEDISNFNGGTDYKLVNSELVSQMNAFIKAGPTTDNNPNLTPYDFSKIPSDLADYHHGIPEVLNFSAFYFKD